ncbi:MAG: lysophospholipid acyltransferase family protein [Minisyncoccales bacterium]
MNLLTSKIAEFFFKPIFLRFFLKEIKGLENVPKGNFILACNHQSHLDELCAGAVAVFTHHYNFHFIGQTDRYRGFVKFLMYLIYFLTGTLMVNRRNEESKKKLIEKAVEVVRRGKVLIIYPEGTRSRDGKLHSLKCGLAKIFLRTGVPILPVAIHGTFDLMPAGRILPKFKRIIKIKVGQALYFKDELKEAKRYSLESREYENLIEKITQEIEKKIKELFSQI